MFAALTKKLLFGVAFFLSTTAAFTAQYPNHAKSTETTVTVHIIWLPSYQAVNHMCSWISGQPIPTNGVIVGCYVPSTSTIYAVEPHSFNDHERLEILGHEFWHALGADHP